MAYVTPTNRSTGDLITAAIWNADVVENMKQNPTEKVTTAGDIVQATASKVIARLGMSGKALQFLRANAGATALEYAEVPTIISADAFQWGTKVANRYTANFASPLLLNNAVFGDLVDVGWENGGVSAPQANSTASSGDLDAADDAGQQFIAVTTDTWYWSSPKVVGGIALLNQIGFHTGTRPTKVTVRVTARFTSTTDNQDTTGVGITTSTNSVPVSAGANVNFLIMVGATNFELWDGATGTDLGVAKDTNVHDFDIEITFAAATYRVLIDDVEVKAAAAIAQDKWPMSVHAVKGATGAGINVFAYAVKYE